MTRRNPRTVTRTARDLQRAAALYEDFTGHRAKVVAKVKKPRYPDAVLVVGDCDGILYTTVRDGKVERYIHEFKKDSRPLFCVSPDGKTLILLGGAYSFTDRGIVDE
jgi:hypothetical protein